MTYDEVLQEPSNEDLLITTLQYLIFTIDEANTIEDIVNSEDYKDAKELLRKIS